MLGSDRILYIEWRMGWEGPGACSYAVPGMDGRGGVPLYRMANVVAGWWSCSSIPNGQFGGWVVELFLYTEWPMW
jgi:hypothetical protein